jgi:hypothetical protein
VGCPELGEQNSGLSGFFILNERIMLRVKKLKCPDRGLAFRGQKFLSMEADAARLGRIPHYQRVHVLSAARLLYAAR